MDLMNLNEVKFSQNFLSKAGLKMFSWTTIIYVKLFTDQSEETTLPAKCLNNKV